jgi:hypothetical protein
LGFVFDTIFFITVLALSQKKRIIIILDSEEKQIGFVGKLNTSLRQPIIFSSENLKISFQFWLNLWGIVFQISPALGSKK